MSTQQNKGLASTYPMADSLGWRTYPLSKTQQPMRFMNVLRPEYFQDRPKNFLKLAFTYPQVYFANLYNNNQKLHLTSFSLVYNFLPRTDS